MSLLFRRDNKISKTPSCSCKQQDKGSKISFIGINGSITHGRNLFYDVLLLHDWLEADNNSCLEIKILIITANDDRNQ